MLYGGLQFIMQKDKEHKCDLPAFLEHYKDYGGLGVNWRVSHSHSLQMIVNPCCVSTEPASTLTCMAGTLAHSVVQTMGIMEDCAHWIKEGRRDLMLYCVGRPSFIWSLMIALLLAGVG